MKMGTLKKTNLFVGNGERFLDIPSGAKVEIVDEEDHYLYGKRYKIKGYEEWFEANCFSDINE